VLVMAPTRELVN